jgi:hypothetical protein
MSSPTAEDQPSADSAPPEPISAEPVTADPAVPGDPAAGEPAAEKSAAGHPAADDPADAGEPAAGDPAIGETAAGEVPATAGPAAAEPQSTPAPVPPFSKVAIAALPAGVLPIVPVGLGLGIAGLVTTRRGRRRGRGLAVAGLLSATAWLAVIITLVTVATLTHGFRKPTKIEYNNQLGTVFSLREGDCVDAGQNATSASITACDSPHDAEVFATFTLPGASWPGTSTVQQEADAGCSSRLASYLNPELAITLSQDYVYPGKVAWQTGTRTVVCEVRAASGLLDASVRAAPAS